jgi:hypothetical protein
MNNKEIGYGLVSNGSGKAPVTSCCELGDEPSGSIKNVEFFIPHLPIVKANYLWLFNNRNYMLPWKYTDREDLYIKTTMKRNNSGTINNQM